MFKINFVSSNLVKLLIAIVKNKMFHYFQEGFIHSTFLITLKCRPCRVC